MDKVGGIVAKSIGRTARKSKQAIKFETANLARLADGSCTCSLGDTSVLVTAISKPAQKAAGSFLPLSVDYLQKAAAAGRIPMTHLRRDIGVTEKEILTSRMIDRSVRTAFPKGYSYETQIICNQLAVDGANEADILAINGASACLALSDIPWNGPVGAVRMGLVGDDLVVNPTRREQDNSRLNIVMTGNSYGNVIMMDGFCREPILIVDMNKTIKQGIKECVLIANSIKDLQKAQGKPKRTLDLILEPSQEQKDSAVSVAREKLEAILTNYTHDKHSRDEAMFAVREEAFSSLREIYPEIDNNILNRAFNYAVRHTYQKVIRETSTRCDGRGLDEIRPITCKVDMYKPLHGSAIFQRGQTQVFCSTTFDSPDAAYRADSTSLLMGGVKEKNFMLHYEFPPYASHEIGRVGAMPNRREIGHGALAERGIRSVVPDDHEMTIRLNCEVLESNGSSSMASVCAGSMSLMDAGVQIKEHVAGVALGLFSNFDEQEVPKSTTDSPYYILTDILGFEDYIGDMDFKIAGTRKGVTALQLDVKPMLGIPTTVVYQAIQKAHVARNDIIGKMSKVIRESRKEKKDNHPVIKTIHIPAHKKAKLIGFGGANLKKLTAQIGVRVSAFDIEGQDEDDYNQTLGAKVRDNFTIFAPNQEAMQEAEEFITKLLEKDYKEPELEFNAIYTATIQELRSNGVMVTLYPNMRPALLPLSQLDIKMVSHPSALDLEVGQQIQVKYFGRDPASGNMRLSRKSLLMSSVSRVHQAPST